MTGWGWIFGPPAAGAVAWAATWLSLARARRGRRYSPRAIRALEAELGIGDGS